MADRRIGLMIGSLLLAGAAAGALAQDRPESILPPGFDEPPPTSAPAPAPPPRPTPAPTPTPSQASNDGLGDSEGETALADDDDPLAPLLEDDADDDAPSSRGTAARSLPTTADYGDAPWGRTRADYLKSLMRSLDAPFASRWVHIALRNALLADGAPPRGMSEADWIAERAWLLLRMGEADAARLLVATVDKGDYDEKFSQVALQAALASSDMAAMCPVPRTLDDVEPVAEPLVDAICAALSGQPEVASDAINRERRRGRVSGIDLALAEKLVGAGSATARAVTLEWEPVSRLTAWRYGLATATGTALPDRLVDEASPQLVAWYARAPLMGVDQRLAAARIATGLGVFSGQAITDLYSQFYDRADADAVANSEALILRRAFVGASIDDRLAAMRDLWIADEGSLQRRAGRALVGRAAARLVPSEDYEDDAAELVASMFAVGLDDTAGRWARPIQQMRESTADPSWAQLALGVTDAASIDLTRDRIDDFMDRDDSPEKWRSHLLMAALGGTGRMDEQTTAAFNDMLNIGLSSETKYTRDITAAAARGEAGTVMLIAAVAMQGDGPRSISPLHLYHLLRALRATGQDYFARMIAAEALAPA
ncbi:hypothetical protein [Sphingomicrobium clamense]|uniref:hypothetical protein n=1 Tax=Sphingomicrobium clamense TaxID=2851013 RepID=UPI002101D974|nr:hypothetical protein [Sphingomicrobium sp. B8]